MTLREQGGDMRHGHDRDECFISRTPEKQTPETTKTVVIIVEPAEYRLVIRRLNPTVLLRDETYEMF